MDYKIFTDGEREGKFLKITMYVCVLSYGKVPNG